MSARIGVCSWSLQPESPAELVEKVRACSVDAVQLALDPIRSGAWEERRSVEVFAEAGLTILSGMMSTRGEDYTSLESIEHTGGFRLDEHWQENLAAAREDAALARRLGLDLVTVHAGFIPEETSDPARSVLVERLRAVIDAYAAEGVRLGLETGQETAATLLEVLDELDRPTLGVNFDPANMILYGVGDPVEALRLLAPRVFQIHIKDALPAEVPGTWGAEVCAGTGAVDWEGFFGVVREAGLEVNLCIEREAGEQRVEDIRSARGVLGLWAG